MSAQTPPAHPREAYARAQALHYETGDLDASLDAYAHLISTHPDSLEAEYAGQQIESIFARIVPPATRVLIALSATRGYMKQNDSVPVTNTAMRQASVLRCDIPQDLSGAFDDAQGREEAVTRYSLEIFGYDTPAGCLPAPLMPQSIRWMCAELVAGRLEHDANKIQRWLGFVQCAMIANRGVSADSTPSGRRADQEVEIESRRDLKDHHDPSSAFRLELGGEG